MEWVGNAPTLTAKSYLLIALFYQSFHSYHIIRSIRVINPAVAVLTLLTLGNAQTRLALLSLTRKVRVRFCP